MITRDYIAPEEEQARPNPSPGPNPDPNPNPNASPNPSPHPNQVVSFTDAVQAACAASPSLLAMAGLAPAQGGAAAQLSAEDSTRLHAVLAAGVAKKAQAAAETVG